MNHQKALHMVLLLMLGLRNVEGGTQGDELDIQHTKLMALNSLTYFPRKARSLMEFAVSETYDHDSNAISCYGEGLYTHPYDCAKFFRCLDIFGNGEMFSMMFTCKEGNIFSAEHKACIAGTCSSDVVSAIALSLDDDNTLVLNEMYLNSTENSTLAINEIPECLTEGRHADPNDCGQYFECVRNANGDLIGYKRSCRGMAFEPTLNTCVPLEEVKECIAETTLELRDINIDEQKLIKLCEENNNLFVCLDCKTLVMCAETHPHIMPCKYGNVCHNNREGFAGGICYPAEGSECACNADDTFKPDIYDPSKFLSCRSTGADPVVKSCPDGLEYNKAYKSCGLPMDITCSVSGTFALESDCTIYQSCLYTTTGWIQNVYKCADKTMFNEITGKCEDPCGWYDGTFECNSEGRFSNPGDCTRFFECIADPNDTGKFTKLEHECPEGYAWLPTVDRRHCVPRGSTAEKCHPQKPNTCSIPSGWCTTKRECPDGFFQVPGSNNQCFKVFQEGRSWSQAKTKCEQDGMVLAKPLDPVPLRNHLHTLTGGCYIWIGGRGTGSIVAWDRDGTTISNDDPLWWSANGEPRWTTDNHCLWLETWKDAMDSHPNEPYRMFDCGYTSHTCTLCELL